MIGFRMPGGDAFYIQITRGGIAFSSIQENGTACDCSCACGYMQFVTTLRSHSDFWALGSVQIYVQWANEAFEALQIP